MLTKGITVVLFVFLITSSPFVRAEPIKPIKGPNVDSVTFIHYQDENVAVQEVKQGRLDMYFWRIPLEVATDLKNDPNVKVYKTPGGRLSILLNPATGDKFNPLSIREVRYAINYLIDRNLIVNEILKGEGTPAYSPYTPLDPDYVVLIDILESLNFKYNPQLADEIISKALRERGAVKVNGKWYYNNEPITLKFFIRNDDPYRNNIGKILANKLSDLGFNIEEINGDLRKANDIVYGSDPKEFKWHIYTEGWGASTFDKYDNTLVAQMYAPWYGYMPGFREEGFWNYNNSTIDTITIKLFNGNYTSKEERDQLLREAVRLGINESVRIFIARTFDSYIARKDVNGVITDLGAGITTRFNLINANNDKGELRIGMKQIYQGAWNPIAGFKDVYSTIIFSAISDPATFRDPHTGDVIPVRADWKVETAGPNGKLDVPSDAFIWDSKNGMWKKVNHNTTAISKVTFDLKYSKWHHGAMMDKYDLLYSIYFMYQWGSKKGDNDTTYDPEYAAVAQQFIKTIKGFRFVNDDKLEVYVDYWHFDNNYIADYASVWSSIPWEITAAMEDLVINKKAAFSKTQATVNNVDWLSLIVKDHANMLKEALIKFNNTNFVPKPLRGMVSVDYAKDRYSKAIEWIDSKDHAVISNGPFYLDNYNPEARTITIKAFRDPTYPFTNDEWKKFENIKSVKLQELDVPLIINRGEESSIKGRLAYNGSYSDITVYYFVKDNLGNIVIRNSIVPSSDKFVVRLSPIDTSKLSQGSNELKLIAISNKALLPDIKTNSIIGNGRGLDVINLSVNNSTYYIGISNANVSKAKLDLDSKSIVLSLSGVNGSDIKVVLPRYVIDSKENSKDKGFIVRVDSKVVNAKEEQNDYERTLYIPVTKDTKEVSITGTIVVPEFGFLTLLIFTTSTMVTLILIRLFKRL